MREKGLSADSKRVRSVLEVRRWRLEVGVRRAIESDLVPRCAKAGVLVRRAAGRPTLNKYYSALCRLRAAPVSGGRPALHETNAIAHCVGYEQRQFRAAGPPYTKQIL